MNIVEKLLDFENEGITHSDRFHLRREAAQVISELIETLQVCRGDIQSGTVDNSTLEHIKAALSKAGDAR